MKIRSTVSCRLPRKSCPHLPQRPQIVSISRVCPVQAVPRNEGPPPPRGGGKGPPIHPPTRGSGSRPRASFNFNLGRFSPRPPIHPASRQPIDPRRTARTVDLVEIGDFSSPEVLNDRGMDWWWGGGPGLTERRMLPRGANTQRAVCQGQPFSYSLSYNLLTDLLVIRVQMMAMA